EVTMENYLFNLQLFADEPADTKGAAGAPETSGAEREPATAAKVEKPDEPRYTDKDVDEILNKKFAEWQKKQQKAVDEAKKLSAMNAQQKAEYERDQLQKELDEYKRAASLAEMTKTARKMLSDSGITIPDELLSMMVSTEADTTKAAVDGFAKAFTEAVESAVKERLKGEPPRKGSGGTSSMTKDQIMAIRDPELRQKKMLENRELFNI
ncbi:MAG: DUF4355 domain-containing protein, partial [Eubacteriales bacterium]